jgi:hypothetical protein
MKKFFAIYRVPVETMQEWRKNTSPKEMKAQGEKLGKDMMAWTTKNKAHLPEQGIPLGKNKRITAKGVEDAPNDLNYACVLEAQSHDEATAIFKDNPHFAIPTSYIDIMEIPHMGL